MKVLVETSAFTDEIEVPEDLVDMVEGSTVETGFQGLANRTRFLNDTKPNVPGSVTEAKIVVFGESPQELLESTAYVDGADVVSANDFRAVGKFVFVGSKARNLPFGPQRMQAGPATTLDRGGALLGAIVEIQAASYGEATVELDDLLRPGMLITSIDIGCTPAAARATESERCLVELMRTPVLSSAAVAPTTIWSEPDDGTNDEQTITVTGTPHFYDPSYRYFLRIRAGISSNDHFGGGILHANQPEVW